MGSWANSILEERNNKHKVSETRVSLLHPWNDQQTSEARRKAVKGNNGRRVQTGNV